MLGSVGMMGCGQSLAHARQCGNDGVWSIPCREDVKWPSDMHPVFKNFLEGLLQKDRKKRLSWPHLLYHPFVYDGMALGHTLCGR